MITFGFSVRDNAVEAFLPPFFARSKGEAIRSFASAVQDTAHQFHKNMDDYVLFELGVYDDTSGVLTGLATPQRVISAVEVGSFQ